MELKTFFAVACFLPGRVKALPAHLYLLRVLMSQRNQRLQERLSFSISSDVYKVSFLSYPVNLLSNKHGVHFLTIKCRRNLKPPIHVYLKHRHKIYTDLSTFSYIRILRRALFYSIITSPYELIVFIDLQM